MASDGSKAWQGSPPTAFKPKKPFMPRLVRSNKPDHVIGAGAVLQGRLEFRGLLRVDGRFEGVLRPGDGANIMVARSGVVVGDLEGCHSAVVEGTVIGNVSAAVVELRRHAYVGGNVWCKDLAAAPTAVFRNRATLTLPPGSLSSPSNHRRSSSASSDPVRGGEGRSRTHSGSSSSRSNSCHAVNDAAAAAAAATATGGKAGDGGTGSEGASPATAGHYRVTLSADQMPPPLPPGSGPASSGGLGRAAGVDDRGTPPTLQLPRAADSAAVSNGAALYADRSGGGGATAGGGGAGDGAGGCPFPGHTRSVATVDDAFACEGASSAASSAAAVMPTAHQPPLSAASSSSSFRSLYNRRDAVAAVAAGGTGSAQVYPTSSSSSSQSAVPLVNSTGRMAHNASPLPQTPPPPTSRRGNRHTSGGGGGTGGGTGSSVLPHGVVATAAESPPRTHRRGGHAGVTGGGGGGGLGRGCPSGFATGAGAGRGEGFGGRRLVAGRWVGCPHPDDIQRVMEQRERGLCAGLGKLSVLGGGGCGIVDPIVIGQGDPWRDCAKDFGVRSTSLTQAFAPVAMLLRFDGGTGFDKHLQTEYAAENLWFWKQGMEFRSATFSSSERRREEARRIYDAFLSEDSPDQVNISHEDRENVLAALEVRPNAPAIGAGLFDDALMQVETMLSLGPFPRFAGSTIKNIEASWTKVAETFGIQDAGESFYSVLFEIEPSVEGLFTRSKRVQGEMLMGIVDLAVKLLDNLQELVPVLIQLGLRHNAYKVRKEHFPVVGHALLGALSLILKKEFTEEVKQSWEAVYTLMSNIMISVLDPQPEDESIESTADTSSRSSGEDIEDSEDSTTPRGSAPTPAPPTPPRHRTSSTSGSNAAAAAAASAAAAVAASEASMTLAAGVNGSDNDAVGGRGAGGREERRGNLASVGSGGGGSGGGSIRGMYRRGTTSFRNQISKLVRKESSTAVGGGGSGGSGGSGVSAESPSSSSTTSAATPATPATPAAAAATASTIAIATATTAAAPAAAGGGASTGSSTTTTTTTNTTTVTTACADSTAAQTLGAATPATMEAAAAATAAAAAAAVAAAAGLSSASGGGGGAGGAGASTAVFGAVRRPAPPKPGEKVNRTGVDESAPWA